MLAFSVDLIYYYGMKQSSPSNSEWLTRKKLIDPKLKAAGWRIVPFSPDRLLSSYDRCAIEEFPTDNGPADYALCVNGIIMGVVEGKKLSLGPQNVLTQAERYSRGLSNSPLNFSGYRSPFLYSTNGEIIWHHDVRHELNRSRKITAFHTPDALFEKLGNNFEQCCRTLANLPNDHDRLRPYQREANSAVEKALAIKKRAMLIAMATGTGKTFTMVNQVYRLMKSGVARRILFLVDRRALAAQAVRSFASFEPEPGLKFDKIYDVFSQRFQRGDFEESEAFDPKVLPYTYLAEPNPGHAFVYVCTIQRMMINLFGRIAFVPTGDDDVDDEAEETPIPIHAFDVIIADECHRGYTGSELQIWRDTLDHFDAVKIGLTATPASHTTSYFNTVVYRYEYERAVREGYLVDYDVVAVNSDIRLKGIFLREGEHVGVVNPETGSEQLDLLEAERQFNAAEIEQRVTAPDSNRKILEELKRYALEHESLYGRFPKMLIFAVNDMPHTSHADMLVDLARDVFGQGDAFVQKITGRVDRPLQRIREFRNRPNPKIAVTVDLLSTGVDIPDLEYIVFLRPVKSRILFEQMLGRGTRKGEKYPDKSHFTVFDCFDGTLIEYFRTSTAMTAEPVRGVPRTTAEIINDIWQNRDRDYNVRCLVKRLQRVSKEMSGDARDLFAAFIPDGDIAAFAEQLPESLRRDFSFIMSILRNSDFQDLLVNYPRPKRTFVVAYEAQDNVSSVWMVRDIAGKEYKPDDYLTAFTDFVKQNADHIDALRILLNKPKEWSPHTLEELRKILNTAYPLNFMEEQLRKAHELHYHKTLIDIISMVKHAASAEEPLYTAQQRVERAFMKITAGRTFTGEQRDWLDRIREHLIANLSIDEEDFGILPVLSHPGGWSKADKVFDGHLGDLIKELNEAIAA